MAKAKKSYSDLQSEINKLLEQQNALKDEQLEIFLKKFQTESFKKKVLEVDPVILKRIAQNIVESFDNMAVNAERQIEAEKAKQNAQPTIAQGPYAPVQ